MVSASSSFLRFMRSLSASASRRAMEIFCCIDSALASAMPPGSGRGDQCRLPNGGRVARWGVGGTASGSRRWFVRQTSDQGGASRSWLHVAVGPLSLAAGHRDQVRGSGSSRSMQQAGDACRGARGNRVWWWWARWSWWWTDGGRA